CGRGRPVRARLPRAGRGVAGRGRGLRQLPPDVALPRRAGQDRGPPVAAPGGPGGGPGVGPPARGAGRGRGRGGRGAGRGRGRPWRTARLMAPWSYGGTTGQSG